VLFRISWSQQELAGLCTEAGKVWQHNLKWSVRREGDDEEEKVEKEKDRSRNREIETEKREGGNNGAKSSKPRPRLTHQDVTSGFHTVTKNQIKRDKTQQNPHGMVADLLPVQP